MLGSQQQRCPAISAVLALTSFIPPISDVISTRRLSYILYLPDPADPWQPEWGGALELYPVKSKGTPADEPSLAIPPSELPKKGFWRGLSEGDGKEASDRLQKNLHWPED